jgi:hypothetical protein
MLKDIFKKIIEKKQKEDIDKLNINFNDNEVKIKGKNLNTLKNVQIDTDEE